MTKQAHGTFEVTLTPQSPDNAGDATLSRLSIDKQFQGDLEGTSKGTMLAARPGMLRSSGSAGHCRVAAAPSCSSTAAP